MEEGNNLIDKVLEAKLGFDRVRAAIADRCSTEYGAVRAAEEVFSRDPNEIRRRLLPTDEMRLIMMFEESFPTGGYVDCTRLVSILEDGGNLDLLGLGKLRTMLQTLGKILSFFALIKEGVYPNLKRNAARIALHPEIDKRIDTILDRYGNIKDTASDLLYEIRRSLSEKEGAVSRRMGAILRKAQQDGIVEADASVSVRDGKMLIPVNSAFKRKLPGFVYDESSSGKTTFIQPAEIVELENEISELHFAENREIARILADVSDFLRPYTPDLQAGAQYMGETDFLMAKAQTALEYIAGMPVLSEQGEMALRKARHPILEKALRKEGKEIVPLTATLTPEKHILLISGPNAGGKSVCLKTVGLLQYMFQWGMLIPTSETSEMTVFDRIMVDIGDGQSIDNDLSTYSSFLVHMKEMLAVADNKTLVLIDELGSGTEPAAGGAIAEAILSELDRRGVYGVITTHYTNLKLYASTPGCGVINGAMQFDAQRIEPLFKLEMGLPGNSFAFELARKMGMPESIIKDAEERAGEEFVGIERNLRKIARNRKALDEKLQKIRNTDKALEHITGKYQKELEEIRQTRKSILDQARKEAEDIVKGANKQVENTIRTIKESQAEKEATGEARKELQDFVTALSRKKEQEQKDREDYLEKRLRHLSERQEREKARRSRRTGGQQDPVSLQQEAEAQRLAQFRGAPLKVGEKVRVKDNGMAGEVIRVSARSVTVAVGNISSKMPADRLERITSNEYKAAVKEAARKSIVSSHVEDEALRKRKLDFSPEIDLRGERVNDALEKVIRYVDDAIMLGMPSVRIIHGKGTGALREEIQKMLRATPGIASVKDEHIQFGGSGVTIVTFE